MKLELVNQSIGIVVDTFGAELNSLQERDQGLELLWQGDPRYWKDQSPILFPFVGGLPNDTYELDGRRYEMGSHGFAQCSEFSVVKLDRETIVLQSESDEKTQQLYPYQFVFQVSYTLRDNCLAVGFQLHNKDTKPMLYSLGAHPGFRCPMFENESMEDYYLLFEKKETINRRIKADGLLTGESIPLLNHENKLTLKHSLFYNDAIILSGLRSDWVELRSDHNSKVVRVEFNGFPYLGIWSAANHAPFVCIEPWYGIDSTHGDSYDLKRKEGIQTLEPNDIFECEYRIIIS